MGVLKTYYEHKENMEKLRIEKEKIKQKGETERTAIEKTGQAARDIGVAIASREKNE